MTTAHPAPQPEDTADLAALLRNHAGERAVLRALPSALPWVHHLSPAELEEFTGELLNVPCGAGQLETHGDLHRIITEWRATARVLATPELTAQLTRPLPDEDHGEVTCPLP
ncbi:prevent-host-death family protein [Streptomyces sp. NPDC091279]|uniref:prevent-host-death family protein n=1 Tax=Streptomyces sp. NPDC091279 TaxID=3365983 RepID=UPI003819ACEE